MCFMCVMVNTAHFVALCELLEEKLIFPNEGTA